jgi:hypothetical protein
LPPPGLSAIQSRRGQAALPDHETLYLEPVPVNGYSLIQLSKLELCFNPRVLASGYWPIAIVFGQRVHPRQRVRPGAGYHSRRTHALLVSDTNNFLKEIRL